MCLTKKISQMSDPKRWTKSLRCHVEDINLRNISRLREMELESMESGPGLCTIYP